MVMQKVAVILANGCEEIEAITIIDVLRRAEIDVTSISISNQLEINGAHGIKIIADALFDSMVDFDVFTMIILPGGIPGTTNLNKHVGLKQLLLSYSEKGKPLGAICAAPLVLGELGLLSGKSATCYPGFEKHLKGASITNTATQVSGNIITGKGAGVAIEFALKIVELLKDKNTSDELAKKLVAD